MDSTTGIHPRQFGCPLQPGQYLTLDHDPVADYVARVAFYPDHEFFVALGKEHIDRDPVVRDNQSFPPVVFLFFFFQDSPLQLKWLNK